MVVAIMSGKQWGWASLKHVVLSVASLDPWQGADLCGYSDL